MSHLTMAAHASIAGSFVVLQMGRNWERYIDAKRDTRFPDFSFIEVVQSGRVIRREKVPNDQAPARIINMAKEAWAH